MATYDLQIFEMSDITTDGPDFTQPDGAQYTLGVSTVTITPGALPQTVSVDDPNDATFDDDDPEPQTLVGDYTINGTSFTNGDVIEAEYLMEVQDSGGTTYYIAAVSFTGDPWWIDGFTIHGAMPPVGEPLTIVNVYDGYLGTLSYASSVPACFEASTGIATPNGAREARHLRGGDVVCLATGGTARLALVLHQQQTLGARREDKPVRLRPDALGPGRPSRALILSPQHRVWHEDLGALVPARALVQLPRVGLVHDRRVITYVHLVLPHHGLVLAEDMACESFWPGKMALAALKPGQLALVRSAMGSAPRPCAPILSMREAERGLTQVARSTRRMQYVRPS